MNKEQLLSYIKENYIVCNKSQTVFNNDCKIIKFLLDNCDVDLPEENRFFGTISNIEIIQQIVIWTRGPEFDKDVEKKGFMVGKEALAYTGLFDFSHTTAEWDTVLSLGIFGLRKRLFDYIEKYKDDEKRVELYSSIISVYDSAIAFMKRVSLLARKKNKLEMANSLVALTERSPISLYEKMQTTIVYYFLQHVADGTYLRTLGRLDSLFYDVYKKENHDFSRQLLIDFFKEIDKLNAPANIPFAIGGTDVNGNSLINELSYELINVYKAVPTNNLKIHILCSKNTPKDIVLSALDGVIKGNNSIVFMSDEKVIQALINLGEERSDAVNYHVVGCYESGGYGELTCSCNARISFPKALEYALNDGMDLITGKQVGLRVEKEITDFEDLYCEFIRQAKYLCRCAMEVTDIYEKQYSKIHSAPILTSNYTCALDKGGDLYCDYTAKYNNSSLNALGLGTAVDSLASIRKLVFEDKKLSLSAFNEILKNDWKDNEPLRLMIKNKFPKYGVGDKNVDDLAKNIINDIAKVVNGAPNVKGGVYRLGTFSINWRWSFGEKTAASADGRKCGEPISQNTGATFGADTKGATAHLLSVASIDSVNTPNGSIVDIDLHSSAVVGENGLNALYSSLIAYLNLGGFAVHYNVLDTEKLKDAKLHPEKYPNLQVRLCGWNVLFNSLSGKEKDEFINRSIKG